MPSITYTQLIAPSSFTALGNTLPLTNSTPFLILNPWQPVVFFIIFKDLFACKAGDRERHNSSTGWFTPQMTVNSHNTRPSIFRFLKNCYLIFQKAIKFYIIISRVQESQFFIFLNKT